MTRGPTAWWEWTIIGLFLAYAARKTYGVAKRSASPPQFLHIFLYDGVRFLPYIRYAQKRGSPTGQTPAEPPQETKRRRHGAGHTRPDERAEPPAHRPPLSGKLRGRRALARAGRHHGDASPLRAARAERHAIRRPGRGLVAPARGPLGGGSARIRRTAYATYERGLSQVREEACQLLTAIIARLADLDPGHPRPTGWPSTDLVIANADAGIVRTILSRKTGPLLPFEIRLLTLLSREDAIVEPDGIPDLHHRLLALAEAYIADVDAVSDGQ